MLVVLPLLEVPLVPDTDDPLVLVLVSDEPLVLELLPGAADELPLVPAPEEPLPPELVPEVVPELELPLMPDDPLELELEPVSDVLPAPELLPGAVVPDVPFVPDAAPLPEVAPEPEAPLAPEVPLPAAPAAPPAPAAVLLRFFAFDSLFFDFCFVAAFRGAVSPVPDAPDVPDVALSRPACSRAILCASASTAAARAGSVLSVTPVAVEELCARLMPARDISEINSASDTFFISISVCSSDFPGPIMRRAIAQP